MMSTTDQEILNTKSQIFKSKYDLSKDFNYIDFELENGIIKIWVTKSGYIDATSICEYFEKKKVSFGSTSLCRDARKYIETVLKQKPIIEHRNLTVGKGYYYHPVLAVKLSEWISEDFGLRMAIFMKDSQIIIKEIKIEKQIKERKQREISNTMAQEIIQKAIDNRIESVAAPPIYMDASENKEFYNEEYKDNKEVIKYNETVSNYSETTIDIIKLIDENPIIKLSKSYHGKLLSKIRKSFNTEDQQVFLASFYCYLNYKKDEFVIDLDNIWKWMGFAAKQNAKKLLEKYFKVDTDYKIALMSNDKRKNEGGFNKESIIMTINTFKKMCMKANTSKSNDIHDYYIKLEDILHELLEEESEDLRLAVSKIATDNVTIKKSYSHLLKTHDNLKKTRNYHKFRKGNAFYAFYDRWRNTSTDGKIRIKFGICDDGNSRFQNHRTDVPELYIITIIYLNENKWLEDGLKMKYANCITETDCVLTHSNHEYVITSDINIFVNDVKNIIQMFNLNVTYEKEEELNKYNNPYDIKNIGSIYENKEKVMEQIKEIVIKIDPIKKIEHVECEKEESEYEQCIEDVEQSVITPPEIFGINVGPETILKVKIKEHKCEFCKEEYVNRLNLLKHLINVHKKTEYDDELKELMENNKKCNICGKDFISMRNRNRHITDVHQKDSKVKCEECDKEFVSIDSLQQHIKILHHKQEMQKCSKCDKLFTSSWNLKAHIDQVHEKKDRVKCTVCGKEVKERNLAKHMQDLHTDAKREEHKCGICDTAYKSKYTLVNHMARVHSVTSVTSV